MPASSRGPGTLMRSGSITIQPVAGHGRHCVQERQRSSGEPSAGLPGPRVKSLATIASGAPATTDFDADDGRQARNGGIDVLPTAQLDGLADEVLPIDGDQRLRCDLVEDPSRPGMPVPGLQSRQPVPPGTRPPVCASGSVPASRPIASIWSPTSASRRGSSSTTRYPSRRSRVERRSASCHWASRESGRASAPQAPPDPGETRRPPAAGRSASAGWSLNSTTPTSLRAGTGGKSQFGQVRGQGDDALGRLVGGGGDRRLRAAGGEQQA